MSRETYEAPNTGSGSRAPALGRGNAESALGGEGPATQYKCGDCNAQMKLKRGDPIRCLDCGHRVLYKERTKRMVQFEAR
ncbi:metallothionein-I gene transcription activator [Calycina marina]|uniref:Metallothionein-I gene transcription activator n=1 Tax=Calycina marina TaxID=1763456 RepID=A0A9P8CDN3_9HELO|nr:metallothionein-I gene transcription activator [Calycina marina]